MTKLTMLEISDFLVNQCCMKHNMDREQAEKYVNKKVKNEDLEKIVTMTNELIRITKDNPSIVNAMLEKLKDLT